MLQIKVKTADNLFLRIKGLIGFNKISPILIKTRWGIHTFGVLAPIDVVILDYKNRVRIIKIGLKPNKVFLWNPVYNKVLELPSGFILQNKLNIGTKISLSQTREFPAKRQKK